MVWTWTSAVALGVVAIACGDREPPNAPSAPTPVVTGAEDEHDSELAALLAFEERRRGETDFAALPPSDKVLGPDPYRIATLRDGRRIGILRGESAVVVIDADGVEAARLPAPRSPSGLAISADGDVLVVGDGARELAHYRVDGGRLVRAGTLAVAALGMRDIALAPDGKTAYVVEERDGRLLALALARGPNHALRVTSMRELGRCNGPVQVEAIAGHVATNCLLDHAIEIRRDAGEVARIQHDGPMWSFAMHREADGGVLVAIGGIEDHPLVREDGGFGYIDSYVFVYRLLDAPLPTRLAAINTSALGLVTPKWIEIGERDGAVTVTTAGFASAKLLALTWRDRGLAGKPEIAESEVPPGTAAAELAADGTWVAANPLLDAWVIRRAGAARVVAVASEQPVRALPSRVGELLFFTTMMAPWNSSEGKLSRFTCESCHYEGYGDGRVHYTGRENEGAKVHATSRPLYGLFNNRPHFSRALDKTMTQMVHAEFRVANRHNGRDPWFPLTRAELPWLAHAGAPERMTPEYLREAFMTFLMDFSHRANPAAQDHTRFTALERAGAQAFRDRCASCHAPRLVADLPKSDVAFERWEQLVLSPGGPIVWSNAAYAKTGVTPFVHDDGARVPALRRLYKKWPYFTNGSARTVAEILDRYAADGKHTYHHGAPATATRLTADDKRALLAFLDLL